MEDDIDFSFKEDQRFDKYIILRTESLNEEIKLITVYDKNQKEILLLKRVSNSSKSLSHITDESRILQLLKTPNIIKSYGKIESKSFTYFIQEHCNVGNLKDFLYDFYNKFKKLPSIKIIRHIIKELCKGVYEMHRNYFLHRDLNPSHVMININNVYELINEKSEFKAGIDVFLEKNYNLQEAGIRINSFLTEINTIMYDLCEKDTTKFEEIFCNHTQIKIINLGLTKKLENDEDYVSGTVFLKSSVPEMNRDTGYNFSSDMWPIGDITLFLLTGRTFDNKENLKTEGKIQCCSEIIDFINNLLQKEPQKRLNFKNILFHPFLRTEEELFTPMNLVKRTNFVSSSNSKDCIWKDLMFEIEDEEESNKIVKDAEEEDKKERDDETIGTFFLPEFSISRNKKINNLRNNTNEVEIQKSFISIQNLTQNYVNYDLVEESLIDNLKNNDDSIINSYGLDDDSKRIDIGELLKNYENYSEDMTIYNNYLDVLYSRCNVKTYQYNEKGEKSEVISDNFK